MVPGGGGAGHRCAQPGRRQHRHRGGVPGSRWLHRGRHLRGQGPAFQTFAVTESGGRWRTAVEIPGTALLNAGGFGQVESLSCPAAGACTAVGYYADDRGQVEEFSVSSTQGRWGRAAPLPGLAALNIAGYVDVGPVSCASPGNCSAGGAFQARPGKFEAFVATQAHGQWQAPEQVQGMAALSAGRSEEVTAISCAGPGSCSAAGTYSDRSYRTQAFVVQEAGGIWGTAQKAPGVAALNSGGIALISSMSCAAPGNCSAAGDYREFDGETQAFIISQEDGRWGVATEAPRPRCCQYGRHGRHQCSVLLGGRAMQRGRFVHRS